MHSAYTYVLNQDDDSVSMFRINRDGTLAPLGTVATGDAPASMAIDPLNRYAYVSNQNADTISLHTIGADGVLSPNGTMNAGPVPIHCVMDPSGRYLYIANFADNTLSQYRISATGTLIANGIVQTGASSPLSLAADPLGRHIYVANFLENTFSQFTIGTDGTLTKTATLATGLRPSENHREPGWAIGLCGGFRVQRCFALLRRGQRNAQFSGDGGRGIWGNIVRDGSLRTLFLYVANYMDSTISAFTIGSGGTLTLLDTVTAGAQSLRDSHRSFRPLRVHRRFVRQHRHAIHDRCRWLTDACWSRSDGYVSGVARDLH